MMQLNLSRYRFSFRVVEPIQFTDYAGSTLRGVFGRSLMRLSGIASDEDIKNNHELYKNSVYVNVFEPPVVESNTYGHVGHPVPYVIEASVQEKNSYVVGDVFYFDMVLMNNAISYLAQIVLAWRRALLDGFGSKKQSSKAELFLVQQHLADGQLKEIYSEQKPTLMPHNTFIQVPEFDSTKDVELMFVTPLRLQHRGRVLKTEELSALILLRSVLRRFSLCFPEHRPNNISELMALAEMVEESKKLKAQDWTRYSNRQKQAMSLTGSVGRWSLKQVPKEWLPYLWVGQSLHVGKNTAFGLGGYHMSDYA